MRDIPPLAALRAFEAAARLGGFARAAADLNISTSAVSHQIRGLEERLGARLLGRSTGAGGVSLTPAGQRLLVAVREGLTLLQEACSDVRGTTSGLTISANPSFSAMWLARRVAEFSARYPLTPVNAIQESEPNFSRHAVDLVIINVKQEVIRPEDVVLLREEVFPVCSPELYTFATHAICECRLLEELHNNSPEIDWRTWSAELGLTGDLESRIVRYSSFVQVVGAAVGGAGLALGRTPLISPELESGRLVKLLPNLSRRASWCFVLRRRPFRRHRMLEPLIEFLQNEAAVHERDARPSVSHR
jgi:LysR family transcriptional regulator, glycine cleavage system transcriptional activator